MFSGVLDAKDVHRKAVFFLDLTEVEGPLIGREVGHGLLGRVWVGLHAAFDDECGGLGGGVAEHFDKDAEVTRMARGIVGYLQAGRLAGRNRRLGPSGDDAAVGAGDALQLQGRLAVVTYHKVVADGTFLLVDAPEVVNRLAYKQFCLFLGS